MEFIVYAEIICTPSTMNTEYIDRFHKFDNVINYKKRI